MSDERLSEETLDELMERCLRYATSDLLMSKEMGRLLTELRALRAAMPTAEEREALQWVRYWLVSNVSDRGSDIVSTKRAIDTLDKLTKEKP